jgi:hypothetical protein
MTRKPIVFAVALAPLLLAPGPVQGPAQNREVLTVRNRFDTTLTYRTAAGSERRVHVSRQQWSLIGQSILPRSPEPGLLVVQLTGGDAKITIGREERTPRGDEFWSVPAGTPMRIDVGREQATLEVLAATER